MDNNLSNDFRDNDNIDLISTFYQVDASGKPSGIADRPEINGTTASKTSTQELRLVSPDDGPFRYLAGLWIARNSVDRDYYRGNAFVKETSFTNYRTCNARRNCSCTSSAPACCPSPPTARCTATAPASTRPSP